MGMTAQQILAQDPEYLQKQLYQQEMQRLNPSGDAAGAIGALLGRGLGNVTAGRGFFESSDPALQRVSQMQQMFNGVMQNFDPADPAKSYETLAAQFAQMGLGQQALLATQEAAKLRKQERELSLREEDLAERRKDREGRVTDVGVTINGTKVFRKPTGGLFVEEGDEKVTYDPKKHGRFETRADAIAEKGVQIRDIPGPGGVGVIGREIYDARGNVIRREYFNIQPTAEGTAQTPGTKSKSSKDRPPLSSFDYTAP